MRIAWIVSGAGRVLLERASHERDSLAIALSREHPYVFNAGRQEYRVGYVPGDSDTGMFGELQLPRTDLDAHVSISVMNLPEHADFNRKIVGER
jgi:hypothetical protein